MITLCAGGDAPSYKLDVVKVYNVQVLRLQALQRTAHTATYGGRGVIKVGCTGTVTPYFGEQFIGAAREFGLESF